MLDYPSPITHRSTVRGALFIVLIAAGSLLLLKPGAQIAPPKMPVEAASVYEPLTQEIGLQESLDRLGYTVNVPASMITDRYPSRDGYPSSTRSDAIHASWFRVNGTASFRKIGQQAYLAPMTNFGMMADSGEHLPLIQPDSAPGLWLDSVNTTSNQLEITGTVRFYIDHPDATMFGPLGTKTLYSTAGANPTHRAQVLVFPARVGGHWVNDVGKLGHWEGGVDTGGYLLCWDDLPEGPQDFQDLIVLASGISPA